MRLLPAARSRRSRRPWATVSGVSGSCWDRAPRHGGSRRLGRGALAGRSGHRLRSRRPRSGICSTLFRPALIALLPSLARTAKRADRGERGDLDDREPRHPARPARRGRAGRIRRRRRRLRGERRGAPGCRLRCSPACRFPAASRACERAGVELLAGLQGDRGSPSRAAPRWPDRLADVRSRVPERAHRRHRVPGAPRGGDGGGLPGGRDRRRGPGRRARRGLAPRRPACAALRLGARRLGRPDHADRAASLPRAGHRPARGDRRCEQRRRRLRVHAPPAHRPRRAC